MVFALALATGASFDDLLKAAGLGPQRVDRVCAPETRTQTVETARREREVPDVAADASTTVDRVAAMDEPVEAMGIIVACRVHLTKRATPPPVA